MSTLIPRTGTIVKASLQVNVEQHAAIALYGSCGFESAGILRKELRVDGVFYDEYIMEAFLC